MLRATTPLPRRPSKEAELLDEVLAAFRRRGWKSATSGQVVRAVNFERSIADKLPAAAVDVRLILAPPYFRLTDNGRWRCLWELG